MRSVTGMATLLSLIVTPMLGSQTAVYGTLQGTVADQAGSRIRGAAVTVVNEATGAERRVVTGGGGRFRVFALPVAKYSIRVELEGFRTYSVSGVGVTSGASVRVRVVLKAAAVEETPGIGSPAVAPKPKGRAVPPPPTTTVPVDDRGPRDPKKHPLSTFSIDVDTASYANIRRFIRQGSLPPKDAVRIEELINYFSYDYPPPSHDAPFSITSELGECPWQSGHKLLLVGIQGREIDMDQRPPSNLAGVTGIGAPTQLNSALESGKVLVTQAAGTLVTIAKDVEIEVKFDPARVAAYRLIGYENRMLRDDGCEVDRKGAGEIGAGHSVTALYEIVPVGESAAIPALDDPTHQEEDRPSTATASSELATVILRYKDPEAEQTWVLILPVRDTGPGGTLPANLGFAAAVAEFGLILRDSEHMGDASHAQVLELARRHKGEDSEDHRVDFIQLVQAAKELR